MAGKISATVTLNKGSSTEITKFTSVDRLVKYIADCNECFEKPSMHVKITKATENQLTRINAALNPAAPA